MTNEEQFEFLRQSIASHDHQLGEITDKLAKVSDGLDRFKEEMEHLKGAMEHLTESQTQTDRQIAATTLNIDRLAAAMMGLTEHAIDHASRIERLEKA